MPESVPESGEIDLEATAESPATYESVHELVPAERQALQRALLDSYKHGLERVDIAGLFEGFTEDETRLIMEFTEVLALSGFCCVNCRECGLSSTPYSRKNRKVFDPEKLIAFLERFPIHGELMLYDATDPLDYPWLFDILTYLERLSNVREIKVFTACPPGKEDVYRKLLELTSRLRKVCLCLSIMPSQERRLSENGITRTTQAALSHLSVHERESLDPPLGIKNVEPQPVGRGRRGAQPGFLSAGFTCGDLTMIDPVRGPCVSEYHISSDLYPDERKVIPVKQARRVYSYNPFFAMGRGGLGSSPTLYRPASMYMDLDTRNSVSETGLRHLVAYLFYIYKDFWNDCSFSDPNGSHFQVIESALQECRFVLPDDHRELEFYRKTIRDLAGHMRADFFRNTAPLNIAMNQQHGLYCRLVEKIEELLERHRSFLQI